MKLSEVFAKADVKTDKKARRITNVSRKTANITAAEIESGVTIERLQQIGVPVFQYSTQVTIHGRLPEFSDHARPAGYKSIFKNQNGTIGVRYVAIDAVKKARLVEIARYCKGKFHPSIDSTGLQLTAAFVEKDDCIQAYESFPRDLFAGTVYAGAAMFGGYYVIAEVGAIPQEHFAALVQYLFGINEDDFNRIKAERDAADAAESERSRREYEAHLQEQDRERNEAFAQVASTISLPKRASLPDKIGSRFVSLTYNGITKKAQAVLYVITKRVFGKLYYAATVYNGVNGAWQPDKTVKQFPLERRIAALKERLDQGYLWHVQGQ